MKNKEKEIRYPYWVWIIFGFIILINLINPILIFFKLGIFFMCKMYFEDWAIEIKKNPIKPFLIVLIFGILGHIGYYIYYKKKKKNLHRK